MNGWEEEMAGMVVTVREAVVGIEDTDMQYRASVGDRDSDMGMVEECIV